MADPCIEDTLSINLSMDGTMLQADLIVDPAGAIAAGASGVKVQLDTASGLEIAANKLRVDIQGNKLVRGAAGLMGINNSDDNGWVPGATSTTVTLPPLNVARGATADIAPAIALNLTNAGTDQTQRFLVMGTAGVDYQTTFPGFETSNAFDSVYVALWRSWAGGAYTPVDYAGLLNASQSQRVFLKGRDVIAVAAGVTDTYGIKPRSTGGTASATAVQGHINTYFNLGISLFW